MPIAKIMSKLAKDAAAKKAAAEAAAKAAAKAKKKADEAAAAAKREQVKQAAAAKKAEEIARQKAAGVKVVPPGDMRLSPKNPSGAAAGPKKPVITNSRTVNGVTTNNKGQVNWGNPKTSKDKIKYGQ
jgi:membrane protein involved in colicin uptake